MVLKLSFNNWLTTIGGILAGVPILITNSGLTLPGHWPQIIALIGGVGTMLIGFAAKDFNTHSTVTQVQQSTAKVAIDELPKV